MLIAIDLRKQQALDADQKRIQKINNTGNLEQDGITTMFFIIEEVKEAISDFLQVILYFLQVKEYCECRRTA